MWPDVRDGKTVRRKKEALIFEKRRKEKEDRKKENVMDGVAGGAGVYR